MKIVYILLSVLFIAEIEAFLAGGRPNSFSGGVNAFAGISNPANAVWIPNRWDVGSFWVNQKSNLFNRDNNPLFPHGKFSTSYRRNHLFSYDAAVTRQFEFFLYSKKWEASVSFAFYFTPNRLSTRTKNPIPINGTTPVEVTKHTQVLSAIFSLKLNEKHSAGISLDYFFLYLNRKGYQNADNSFRSVSPGSVTNNGLDHSGGIGITLGWRWKITQSLDFGLAWIPKCKAGKFKKYKGFEPHHGKNFIPQSIGSGFGYRFSEKLRGRFETLWMNYKKLPGANQTILPNGKLNPNKRGSNKSPGPALQNATFINLGLGYQLFESFSFGIGLSHRLKTRQGNNFLIHPYKFQTIFNRLTLGINFKIKKNDCFLTFSRGFTNHVNGEMPKELGGGRFSSEKSTSSVFFSWGHLY